ncbi:hypothetical protein FNV43_RR26156 [Rhamnella rubrinervis]|uniref:RING-type E3 ubiquitin transferase n=1 Tax=Rhamnella rubrinervis TaxID=2594499 RepID=A0A8K0GR78_9ROSA|nr:hypothetical protein FNV43_RR26156 [Rhamnella rubrinervis]
MDIEYGFDENFYACKVKPLDKPPSSLNPSQVSMEFVYKTYRSHVHVDSYDEFHILSQFEEFKHTIFLFCPCIFCDPSALYPVLSSLQIDPNVHQQIADKILACGNWLLSSCNDDGDGGRVFSLVVNITRTRILYWFDKEYMAPATKQSIKEVSDKLVRVVGNEEEGGDDHDVCSNSGRVVKSICENETCGVCLDKFCIGTYACEMPCSHIFHPNCIVTWLNKSHYCPLCRFEMPTN